ncbi:CCA tRNA nucleotidyltransferase [Vagococcus coleopterorum]|uniref:CCA-adding enzyme n=1 Tax=Vagococcus coleopterorum TaxID=2714946 RepID=A0A6G8ANR3_9ENTE|nr:CCA tRNA nucleotidyltransferase [Vagococcus coleopterorum]QIL46610.1 CCA tRNA nucleotidyltransferase [Vagococcus coleopterorum]
MIINNLPVEFLNALPVLQALEAEGFEAYFVGGSVRDVLLNKPIHDVDIATSAYPEEVKKIFPKTIDVGIEHGTVLALVNDGQYEITTFRTESTYQDFRRPDQVTFVRSLDEDLKRRDFTINAFAMNQTGEVVDLFDGMTDLENRVIRAVGVPIERFNEDALRVMRGLRFAGQLGFSIEEQTFKAIKEAAPLLEKISIERIQIEFSKLLLSKGRKSGIESFVKSEAYQYCPGLKERSADLEKLIQLPEVAFQQEKQAWLFLVYSLGLSKSEVKPWLKQWKLSNNLIKSVQNLLVGLLYREAASWSNEMLYQIGLDDALLIEESLMYLNQEYDVNSVVELYKNLPIKSIQDLDVDGQYLIQALKKPAGPWVGKNLSAIQREVLIGQLKNDKDSIVEFIINHNQ